MELIVRAGFVVVIGAFLWLLHRVIGRYPEPLPRGGDPGRSISLVLVLWAVAVAVPLLRLFLFTPWLREMVPDRTLRELIQLPLLTIPYLVFPILVVLGREGWTRGDLGLTLRPRSSGVALFAVAFGLASGLVPYLTGQAVIGIEPIPAGALVLLLYNNDFLEEFYHRGIIQSMLERSVGQRKAVVWGGILFGLTHVAFDMVELAGSGIAFILIALLLQTMAGWLLGIVYMKTRSLWPGVVCHYLANWLPQVLMALR